MAYGGEWWRVSNAGITQRNLYHTATALGDIVASRLIYLS